MSLEVQLSLMHTAKLAHSNPVPGIRRRLLFFIVALCGLLLLVLTFVQGNIAADIAAGNKRSRGKRGRRSNSPRSRRKTPLAALAGGMGVRRSHIPPGALPNLWHSVLGDLEPVAYAPANESAPARLELQVVAHNTTDAAVGRGGAGSRVGGDGWPSWLATQTQEAQQLDGDASDAPSQRHGAQSRRRGRQGQKVNPNARVGPVTADSLANVVARGLKHAREAEKTRRGGDGPV